MDQMIDNEKINQIMRKDYFCTSNSKNRPYFITTLYSIEYKSFIRIYKDIRLSFS